MVRVEIRGRIRVRVMVRAGCIHMRQIRADVTCDSGGAGARW